MTPTSHRFDIPRVGKNGNRILGSYPTFSRVVGRWEGLTTKSTKEVMNKGRTGMFMDILEVTNLGLDVLDMFS